MLQLYLKFF